MSDDIWDALLFLSATPHVSGTVTTAVRMLRAGLDLGARMQVWACGSATLLTHSSLGKVKPHNMRDRHTEYPTTAALVAELLAEHPDTLRWNACRFCSDDRGAVHIEPVRVRSPLRIADQVAACRKTVYLGGV